MIPLSDWEKKKKSNYPYFSSLIRFHFYTLNQMPPEWVTNWSRLAVLLELGYGILLSPHTELRKDLGPAFHSKVASKAAHWIVQQSIKKMCSYSMGLNIVKHQCPTHMGLKNFCFLRSGFNINQFLTCHHMVHYFFMIKTIWFLANNIVWYRL